MQVILSSILIINNFLELNMFYLLLRGTRHQPAIGLGSKINKMNGNHFVFDNVFRGRPGEDIERAPGRSVPNYADILVACSTVPGFVSFRDRITGTWYIQTLCDVFMKFAHNHHIQDLLMKV